MITAEIRLELTSADEEEIIGLKDAAVMALEPLGAVEITGVRVWTSEQLRLAADDKPGWESERQRLQEEAIRRSREEAMARRMKNPPKSTAKGRR